MNREIRTPDEIKKGIGELKKLRSLMTFDPSTGEDIDPFFLNEENRQLYEGVGIVLQYIRQLEAERDAAIADMKEMAQYVADDVCAWCDQKGCKGCAGVPSTPNFKWRGV